MTFSITAILAAVALLIVIVDMLVNRHIGMLHVAVILLAAALLVPNT